MARARKQKNHPLARWIASETKNIERRTPNERPLAFHSTFRVRCSVFFFISSFSPNGYFLAMLKTGILNPHILSLLARVRHTNTLVIADRGFPFWPPIETVDISLVDNVPTVLDVLRALRSNFVIGKAWMAQEFLGANDKKTQAAFAEALKGISLTHEPHVEFKKRVPHAIGLIRTGDTTQYANVILESA
jgi:D-ribose pyranase